MEFLSGTNIVSYRIQSINILRYHYGLPNHFSIDKYFGEGTMEKEENVS
jgi:hypothetical protein